MDLFVYLIGHWEGGEEDMFSRFALFWWVGGGGAEGEAVGEGVGKGSDHRHAWQK